MENIEAEPLPESRQALLEELRKVQNYLQKALREKNDLNVLRAGRRLYKLGNLVCEESNQMWYEDDLLKDENKPNG